MWLAVSRRPYPFKPSLGLFPAPSFPPLFPVPIFPIPPDIHLSIFSSLVPPHPPPPLLTPPFKQLCNTPNTPPHFIIHLKPPPSYLSPFVQSVSSILVPPSIFHHPRFDQPPFLLTPISTASITPIPPSLPTTSGRVGGATVAGESYHGGIRKRQNGQERQLVSIRKIHQDQL